MNNKITLYNLLGLVKDGQAPKKIKYNEHLWFYNDENSVYINEKGMEFEDYMENALIDSLNDEVEILANEDEDIEEMTMCTSGIMGFDAVEHITTELKDKLNNLVREVNKLKKEGK